MNSAKAQNDLEFLESDRKERPFGHNQEAAIIALCLSNPEFFHTIISKLKPELFSRPEARFVYAVVDRLYQKYETIPSRDILREEILRLMTVDDNWQSVLEIIDSKCEHRDIPVIKETIISWAREQSYGLLYSEDAIDAYERGDFDHLDEIAESARRLTDVTVNCCWFFDDNIVDRLFEEDAAEHMTTGFPKLDEILNDGGPSKKETLVYVAPTGIGKSIVLINNGASIVKAGGKVLHITLELSEEKTQVRYMGALLDQPTLLSARRANRHKIKEKLRRYRDTIGNNLVICEFAQDEISVDTVYQIIDYLKKTKNFVPDAVIIDYLELMLSKNRFDNRDDYTRQKRVATQVCGLGKNENVLVLTASQTNRSGTAADMEAAKGSRAVGPVIDLNKIAESFGKTMPVDYVVTMNQTKQEYSAGADTGKPHEGKLRFFVAKNRNGPRAVMVRVGVNYINMKMRQEDFLA